MIRKADCPSKLAESYPGKYSKNNPAGSLLTKKQYTEKQVQDWIDHFGDSQEYQDESFAHKVTYLVRHLKALNITRKETQKFLVQLEGKPADGRARKGKEGELENNDAEEEMEYETGEENQVAENFDNVEMIESEYDSDVDMFADDDEDNRDKKRAESDFELANVLAKSDLELFEEGLEVSAQVKRSKKYIERKSNYSEKYVREMFEGLSSQDILSSYSQNPIAIQESQAMKERLKHLGKQEKANKVVLKSVQDTIDALQRTPGQKAKDQVKIITASVTHHRAGKPNIPQVSWRTAIEAKTMKLDLLQGTDLVLTPPAKPKRQIYPKELEDLATKHWNENTTIEPALHRRKAESDERETIPTRYQSLTDNEQYDLFKEDCSAEITQILRKHAETETSKVNLRPDSEDKINRLAYFARLPNVVPKIDWFLNLKPSEVKRLHDHTTALCKVCEAALLNFTTLVKTIKLQCKCKTTLCPDWVCLCSLHEDQDDDIDEVNCTCKCACDSCSMCQVNILNILFSNSKSTDGLIQ